MSMTYIAQLRGLTCHCSSARIDKELLGLIAGRDGSDSGGRPCFASYDTLASELGRSKRTVIRRLTAFKKAGWITITRRPNDTALISVHAERIRASWNGREVPGSDISGSDKNPEVTNSGSDKNRGSEVTHKECHLESPKVPSSESPDGDSSECARETRAPVYAAFDILQSALDSIVGQGLDDEPFGQDDADAIVGEMMLAWVRAHDDRAEWRASPEFRFRAALDGMGADLNALALNGMLGEATEALAVAAELREPGSSAALLRDMLAAARAKPGFMTIDDEMRVAA